MLFFLSIDDRDRRSFVLKGKSIQRELFLLSKINISSHIIAEHGKIPFDSKVNHNLFSQPPNSALLRKHNCLLLVVTAYNDLNISRRNSNVLSCLGALNHLKKQLNCFEAYLWVLFNFIHYL